MNKSALVGVDTPTEQTAALIALLHATNRIAKVVHADGRKALRARAKQLSERAKALKDAIAEMCAVMAAMTATAGAAARSG